VISFNLASSTNNSTFENLAKVSIYSIVMLWNTFRASPFHGRGLEKVHFRSR